jgi:hypothetical protein
MAISPIIKIARSMTFSRKTVTEVPTLVKTPLFQEASGG